MAELRIDALTAEVDGRLILNGIDLVVASGEVHAVMGPNGSGKSTLSHVLMGKPGYTVTGGSVTLDGVELLGLPTWKRAQAGLFLAMQYPVEVPGVSLHDLLTEAFAAEGRDTTVVPTEIAAEAERIGFAERIHSRALNVDLSGGEKKRNETLQLAVLRPRFAVLDELDSGLDIDALRAVRPTCGGSHPRQRPGCAGHHPLQAVARRVEARCRARALQGTHRGHWWARTGR